MSHALRFKINDTNESPDAFAGRISAEMREWPIPKLTSIKYQKME